MSDDKDHASRNVNSQREGDGPVEEQRSSEQHTTIQTVYYGPTVLGDKNPTSGYGAAASATSEHNDPLNMDFADIDVDTAAAATSNFATPVEHISRQGPQTTSKSTYIYYGPTMQGHKNPTSSYGTTTSASVLPPSSQLYNPLKVYSADTAVTGNQDDISTSSSENMPTTRISLPEELKVSEELAELQSCYTDIVTSMPENYLETVELLKSHLCKQHISEISGCSSAIDANQIIMKCLIEKATSKSDIIDLCETLLCLKNASKLVCIVGRLRETVIQSLQDTQTNEPPTLPEVTTHCSDGDQNSSSSPNGPNATEQAEALSQAVNLMNQMGMGPIISSMFGAQGTNEALCTEIVSQSAKLMEHMAPAIGRMGTMMQNMGELLSSNTNQDQDTDVHESTSNQSQQAAKIMSDAEELFDEMGIRSVMSNFMSTMEDSGGITTGQFQQFANAASQSAKLLNLMDAGGVFSAFSHPPSNPGGSEAQGNSETTPQATEIIQQAVNAVASNLRLHQDTSDGEQQPSDISDMMKQVGSLASQLGPRIAEKFKRDPKDQLASHSAKPNNIQRLYVYNKEDQVAALASFDSYYDLLMLLDPNPLEEKFIQLDIFPDGEQHLCSDEEAACCPKIDALLKKARSIIVSKGAAMFIEMVKIISQMKTCKELAYHLIGCYISSGAHTIPEELKNLETSLSRAELTRNLKQHQSD